MRAKTILWRGYQRSNAEELARLLMGVSDQRNRLALHERHPEILGQKLAEYFIGSQADDGVNFRIEALQGWVREALAFSIHERVRA